MAAREAENHPCVDAFRTWLERLGTGCRFASHLASNALIHYELVTDPLTAEWVKVLDAHFDQAASEKKVVVTILPSLAWPSEIAEALVVLASMGRWSCTRVPSKRDEAAGNGLVRLHWRNAAGSDASAMGLAPLRCMPITRRAPFVAVVLWPGGRDNPWPIPPNGKGAPRPTDDPIGVVDIAHGLAENHYGERWTTTRADVKKMVDYESEDLKLLRDIAFRLPLDVVVRHFGA